MPQDVDQAAARSSSSLGLIMAAASWGLFWGGWAALLPEIKVQIDASDTVFGLALFGIPLCALPAMLLTGSVTKRSRNWTLPAVLPRSRPRYHPPL